MIPALLAVPLVEGLVGQVVGALSSSPNAPAAPVPAFTPALNSATSVPATLPSATSPTGIMRADQWSQMSNTDMTSWTKSLTGSHVDATDASGRTVSGVVTGVVASGNSFELNIGGHLVSLSSLKQISWSPSL